jgi:hypothetical protein
LGPWGQARLRFIRAAQAAGLTLVEIASIINVRDYGLGRARRCRRADRGPGFVVAGFGRKVHQGVIPEPSGHAAEALEPRSAADEEEEIMNCLDCAANGQVTPAVGVCHDCGAGVCADHVVSGDRHLTRLEGIGMKVKVEPPARLLRCEVCTAAVDAVREASRPRTRLRFLKRND